MDYKNFFRKIVGDFKCALIKKTFKLERFGLEIGRCNFMAKPLKVLLIAYQAFTNASKNPFRYYMQDTFIAFYTVSMTKIILWRMRLHTEQF